MEGRETDLTDNLPPSLIHCLFSFLLCIVDFLFLGHVFKQSCEERVKYRLLRNLNGLAEKRWVEGTWRLI